MRTTTPTRRASKTFILIVNACKFMNINNGNISSTILTCSLSTRGVGMIKEAE